jgi:hypothetical protein
MSAKPNPRAPLGQGGRFAALRAELARRGVRNPSALAAYIGRKKYGKKKFQMLAAKGRREAS